MYRGCSVAERYRRDGVCAAMFGGPLARGR
jgi:hypothetical protein